MKKFNIHPGAMVEFVLRSLFKKPATINYPFDRKTGMPLNLRGKLLFDASKCIGCQLCVKDCPTNAIRINKIGEKQFEAEVDLGKCIYCGQCVDSCVKKSLSMSHDFELATADRGTLKVKLQADK